MASKPDERATARKEAEKPLAEDSNNGTPAKKSGLPALPKREPLVAPAQAFGEALIKRSVATLCLSAGFDVAEGGALAALSTLCVHRIEELGLSLKNTAETSQRKLVTLEDFAETVPALNESILVPVEPFQVLSGVPSFPYEPIRPAKRAAFDSGDNEVKHLQGLHHLPPLPPAHTYKRTKKDLRELTSDEVAQHRREQQKSSAIVRESLAKMRERQQQ